MKPIVITGAGGGIGHTLVDDLLTRGGYRVACQHRSESPGLRQVMTKHGLDFDEHCFQVDMTDELQVSRFGKQVHAHLGGIWGLVNLVGASSNVMSWKMSLNEFNLIVAANLTTTFLSCREFTPDLRFGGGRIINTSSVVAFTGTAGAAHYCAAKAGIVGYTRALAVELAPKNVTANVLALGYFDAGLINHLSPALQDDIKSRTPLKRFGRVSEVSALVHFLLSDDGAFTTGQVHHVNGGYYL